jgi:hypothetical protein
MIKKNGSSPVHVAERHSLMNDKPLLAKLAMKQTLASHEAEPLAHVIRNVLHASVSFPQRISALRKSSR